MISGILHDALLEIEGYQQREPEMYADLAPDINECKTAMRTLLVKLDTIPRIQQQNPVAKALLFGGLIAGGAYLLSQLGKEQPVEVAS
jgi:hypothetical protein